MSWKEKRFADFKLYAVTDIKSEDMGLLDKVDQACRGGADIIQMRSKTLSDQALYRLGLKFKQVTEKNKKLLFVNDRFDIALSVGADGVHIGQDDLPVAVIRKILRQANAAMWIGKSTHSPEQGLAAEQEDVDYLGVGPVYATPTKAGYRPAGLAYVQFAAREFKKPFVAIGGIDAVNVSEVVMAGAQRIAAVRAIFNGDNVYENTVKIRKSIETF